MHAVLVVEKKKGKINGIGERSVMDDMQDINKFSKNRQNKK